jgi:hypothetical protein
MARALMAVVGVCSEDFYPPKKRNLIKGHSTSQIEAKYSSRMRLSLPKVNPWLGEETSNELSATRSHENIMTLRHWKIRDFSGFRS